MKFKVKVEKEVEAKLLSIHLKARDEGIYTLHDDKGLEIVERSDCYVPSFFPGGGGDYIELQVDIETGKILNWVKPSDKQLKAFVEGDDE